MIVCARADWTTRQLEIPAIVATVRSTNRIRVGIDFLSSPGTKAPVSPPKSTCAAVLSQPARDPGMHEIEEIEQRFLISRRFRRYNLRQAPLLWRTATDSRGRIHVSQSHRFRSRLRAAGLAGSRAGAVGLATRRRHQERQAARLHAGR